MGYFFERNESVPTAIRRMLAEQLEEASFKLSPTNDDLADGVHDARKCFKKIRSLLSLVQGELGQDLYRLERDRFQQMGRQLSLIRDSEAIIEAFDNLESISLESDSLESDALGRTFLESTAADSVPLLKSILEQRRDSLGFKKEGIKNAVFTLSRQLNDIRLGLEQWPIEYHSFSSIAANYRVNYKRGKRLLKLAYQQPSNRHFHQWRKRTKEFGYHSRLLRECCPEIMDERISSAKKLEDLLGQDHDLAVLQDTIKDSTGQHAFEEISGHAQQRQQNLRNKAHRMGKKLYKMSSRRVYQDVTTCWHQWKTQNRPTDEQLKE
jgi:CHAD domain-containing protein